MSSQPSIDPHKLVQALFQPALPARRRDAHKGDFGCVAIVGGDAGMVGAALLSARAALLSGAGRVYAALLAPQAPSVDECYPELMLRSSDDLAQLSSLHCVVIGPGLGQSAVALAWLEFWLEQSVPLLLDADALNLIAAQAHLRNQVKIRVADTVITPHVGEAARLLAVDVGEIQKNRVASAVQLAQSLRAVCVLKGADSICADKDGHWFVNTTGNPALATAGTGDVLSGMIGSFMAQGLTALNAVKLGVFVHGAAADALVARGVGPVGLTASELALEARCVIQQLNKLDSA